MSACSAVQGRRDKRSVPLGWRSGLEQSTRKTRGFPRILIPRRFSMARLRQRMIEDLRVRHLG